MERGRETGRGCSVPDLRLIASYHAARSFANHLFCNQLAQIGPTKPSFPRAPPCPAIAVKNEAYPIALTAFASSSSFSEAKWARHCPSLSLSLCCCLRAVEVSPRLTGQVKNVHPSCLACIEQYAGPCVLRLRAHSYLQLGRQQQQQQQRGPLKWL